MIIFASMNTENNNKKAVVLLSGGLDSTTALHLAKSQGFELYALTINYGQKNIVELEKAKKQAELTGVKKHFILDMQMSLWGGSALTDNNIPVEDGDINRQSIPTTYVPARNMIFLSLAASVAETVGAQDIFIGVSQVDYSGYVDCREEFIEAMQNAVNQGTVCAVVDNKPIRLNAPFINMTKTEEIKLGVELGVDYKHTHTCYAPQEAPCGKCDSCKLRAKAFAEAGVVDPALS
ncbi:MAG: 7-cyano-7-deazaguanine synthase QueC [Bacteroidales bacterium]